MNYYKIAQNEPNRLSPEEEAELQELMKLQQQNKILGSKAQEVAQNIEYLAQLGETASPTPDASTDETDILNEFKARRKQQRKAQTDPRTLMQKVQQQIPALETEIAQLNQKLDELTQRFNKTHQDRSQWNDMIKQRWIAQAGPLKQSLLLNQNRLARNKKLVFIIMNQLRGKSGHMPQASIRKDMHYYKIAQTMTQPELQQAYESAEQEANSGVRFRGMGMSEILTIPGSNTPIAASELLNQIRSTMGLAFKQYGIHTIDTDPIPATQAVGLANSHEPGVIHIDLQKLFNAAKRILPPTAQLDSPQMDPDVRNSIISKIMAYISYWLQSQLVETSAHEGRHRQDFTQKIQEGAPDMNIEEYPAEAHGKQVSQQMVEPFPRSLEY